MSIASLANNRYRFRVQRFRVQGFRRGLSTGRIHSINTCPPEEDSIFKVESANLFVTIGLLAKEANPKFAASAAVLLNAVNTNLKPGKKGLKRALSYLWRNEVKVQRSRVQVFRVEGRRVKGAKCKV